MLQCKLSIFTGSFDSFMLISAVLQTLNLARGLRSRACNQQEAGRADEAWLGDASGSGVLVLVLVESLIVVAVERPVQSWVAILQNCYYLYNIGK